MYIYLGHRHRRDFLADTCHQLGLGGMMPNLPDHFQVQREPIASYSHHCERFEFFFMKQSHLDPITKFGAFQAT